MSGSLSFKFKKPINWAYAPGLTKAGADGSIGNTGKNGNAVYFIDYELNNSYNVELAQQKLENNFTLSGNSIQMNENRTYHSGDLIITSNGNCYRIEKGEDSYYTFNINYLGRISYNKTDTENKVIGLYVYFLKDDNYNFDSGYYGFVPNNRQYLESTPGINGDIYKVKYSVNSNTSSTYLDDIFYINGIWCKFFVITEDSSNNNEKYSVEIRFKNKKTYQFNSNSVSDFSSYQNNDPTDSPLSGVFQFNKTLEFPSPNLTMAEFINLRTTTPLEIANYEGPAYFLSDMSLDKMHLYNNDIKPIVTVQNDKTYISTDGISEVKIAESSEQICRHSIPNFSWPDGNSSAEVLVPAMYSIYNLNESFDDSSLNNINWRGGESAYFSSYNGTNITEIIEDFIKNADFRIIQHNNINSTIKFIEINPEFIE